MREFRGKVAVIPGAANGIGRALARRFAYEGMRVVLADLNGDRLEASAGELRAMGADVLAVPADVSQARDIEALADASEQIF